MQPYFTLIGHRVPAYWVFGILGFMSAYIYVLLANRRDRLPRTDVVHIALMAVVGGLVGSKLLYILTLLPLFADRFAGLIRDRAFIQAIVSGGSVYYGGLFGAIGCMALYNRRYRLSQRKVFGLFTPAFALFHAFGRIGCFFTGCCYGIRYSFGFVYRQSPAAPNGVVLLPVQLIECACNLVIFAVLVLLRKNDRARSMLLPVYLMLYAAVRFVLEYFRGDEIRGRLFFFTVSQWIALLSLILSLLYLMRLKIKSL